MSKLHFCVPKILSDNSEILGNFYDMSQKMNRNIYLLIDRCLQFGADAFGWRRELCVGLSDLFEAPITMNGEVRYLTADDAEVLFWVDHGWQSAEQKQAFVQYQIEGANGEDPLRRAISGLGRNRFSISAMNLVGEEVLRASDVYRRYFEKFGLRDQLVGAVPCGDGTGDRSNLIACHRFAHQPDFTASHRRGMSVLLDLIGPLVGTRLADTTDPICALTPKQRQALNALLSGQTERDCAARMGISPRTFHTYVGELYALFGVNSRAALQASFHGRGQLAEDAEPLFEPRNNRIRRASVPMAQPWERRSRFARQNRITTR